MAQKLDEPLKIQAISRYFKVSFIFSKAAPPEDELADTIRAVHAGREKLAPRLAERLAARQKRPELSQREIEVLQLLVRGRSNKEIGSSLFITEDTVKAHLKTLFVKLGVQDRTDAAITAIRQGIVHLT